MHVFVSTQTMRGCNDGLDTPDGSQLLQNMYNVPVAAS